MLASARAGVQGKGVGGVWAEWMCLMLPRNAIRPRLYRGEAGVPGMEDGRATMMQQR